MWGENSYLQQKRVGRALGADRRRRAVAADDPRGIGIDEQLACGSRRRCPRATFRRGPSGRRAAKERVAGEERRRAAHPRARTTCCPACDPACGSRASARAPATSSSPSVESPSSGDRLERTGEPGHAHLLREVRVERAVGVMQQPGAAAALAQRPECADVIEVRVRVNEVARSQAVRVQAPRDRVDVVAAVDDDRFAARGIAEDRAVTRQHPDRERLDDHGSMCEIPVGAVEVARAARRRARRLRARAR